MKPARHQHGAWWGVAVMLLLAAGCRTLPPPEPAEPPVALAEVAMRQGEEIVVAGRFFPTGTRVITWLDDGGFNAHAPPADTATTAGSTPDNFGRRNPPGGPPTPGETAPHDLADLRELVDQFVIHYDSEGLSRRCFEVLQKRRLSAHFLLDLDGTVYQTLDLRERAYHATIANSRSIGIEIANIGALGPDERAKFAEWYQRDPGGALHVAPPERLGGPGIRTVDFIARPVRSDRITGEINGRKLEQYDFTPEQYAALIRLTAALHHVFPRLTLDCPRDAQGRIVAGKLSPTEFEHFRGLIGHFHIQANKVDPGPAFQWDRVIDGARALHAIPVDGNPVQENKVSAPAPGVK